jgi:oxygen-dependent protoporphyrinogen oxidase
VADVCVVGGGIAGLVVARRLALAGRRVVLYEAGDRLGGSVGAHVVAGLTLDAGAESFAARGGTVQGLAGDLGLAGDVVEPAPVSSWLQPATGAPVPMPATSLLGIPADPLAPDVVTAVGPQAAHRAALDARLPRSWGAQATTLGALVRARMGAGLLDALVAPVTYGVHSLRPDALELDRVAPGLREALARHGSLSAAVVALRAVAPPGSAVRGLRGGVHRLVPALADELARLGVDVRLRTRIEDVHGLPGTVVVAAPGVAASAAPGRRITLVTLVVEQPELDDAPRGSGLLVAPGAHAVGARALTHSTAKWAWLRAAAGGRHVLRLSYDHAPDDALDAARADAQTLLGVRLPASCVVDADVVTLARPAAATPPAGVLVVGETVAGAGLAGIVAHANLVVDQLLAADDDARPDFTPDPGKGTMVP